MKTEREKFEEWYTKTNQSNINDSCWCIGGFYTDRVVQRSWEAWQAAKADAVQESKPDMIKTVCDLCGQTLYFEAGENK